MLTSSNSHLQLTSNPLTQLYIRRLVPIILVPRFHILTNCNFLALAHDNRSVLLFWIAVEDMCQSLSLESVRIWNSPCDAFVSTDVSRFVPGV